MNVSETKLRAYVDDELDAQAAADVEAALQSSPRLREQASLMQASRLPYRAAFAAEPVAELPQALGSRIESWMRKRDEAAAVPQFRDTSAAPF